MCTPNGIAESVVSALEVTTSAFSEYKTNKNNYDYRKQVALNNAKTAQNEAMRQKQLGIEASRKEKISALQEVNKTRARNSASNLDSMSETNKIAYSGMIDLSESSAKNTQKEYDLRSHDYFNQANDYLNQINYYKKDYTNSFLTTTYNALGKYKKVADDWYGNEKGVV